MTIRRLPLAIANQIAAGEVVERPASIVKECVENAIDAGAKKVQIVIKNAGLELIQIVDDGKGISKDELAIALERHATSKISTTNDLAAIATLGFRGEALASIAAVSRLKLISQPQNQAMPWSFTAPDGPLTQDSGTYGTCIQIRDLFYNIPARKRFLKSPKTELFHIEEVFKRLALASPMVSFVLQVDDRQVYNLPACVSLNQSGPRLAKIFSANFVENATLIDDRHNDIGITGWVSRSHIARRQPDRQYFFVNNRAVKDKLLSHAISNAHQFLTSQGLYPSYCLFLTLPASEVDVNVHPTKHEVRFHQARLVHDFVQNAIEKGAELIPTLQTTHNIHISQEKTAPPVWSQQSYARTSIASKNTPIMSDRDPVFRKGGFRLIVEEDKWLLINCAKAARLLSLSDSSMKTPQPCMFPETVKLSDKQWRLYDEGQAILLQQGWGLKELNATDLSIVQVPSYIPMTAINDSFKLVLESLEANKAFSVPEALIHLMTASDLKPYLARWLDQGSVIEITEKELSQLW